MIGILLGSRIDLREGTIASLHLVLLFLGLSLVLNLVMPTNLLSSIAFLPGDENDGAKKELKPFPSP